MTGNLNDEGYQGFLSKLNPPRATSKWNMNPGLHKATPWVVAVPTKKSRRSEQFADVSKANTDVVDKIANIAEKLANEGRGTEAKELIGVMKDLLINNQELQKVVSDTLLDIPNN